MTAVEWGRAPRGRTWHVLSIVGLPLCDDHALNNDRRRIAEVLDGLPPRGGRPCGACATKVGELSAAVAAAKVGSTVYPGVVVERDDVVDAEIVDAEADRGECARCGHSAGFHTEDENGACIVTGPIPCWCGSFLPLDQSIEA